MGAYRLPHLLLMQLVVFPLNYSRPCFDYGNHWQVMMNLIARLLESQYTLQRILHLIKKAKVSLPERNPESPALQAGNQNDTLGFGKVENEGHEVQESKAFHLLNHILPILLTFWLQQKQAPTCRDCDGVKYGLPHSNAYNRKACTTHT